METVLQMLAWWQANGAHVMDTAQHVLTDLAYLCALSSGAVAIINPAWGAPFQKAHAFLDKLALNVGHAKRPPQEKM